MHNIKVRWVSHARDAKLVAQATLLSGSPQRFNCSAASSMHCRSDYARCRIELSAARLTVLAAAHALDQHGNKRARGQIAAAKVYAPNVVLRVIDAAVQVLRHADAAVSANACVRDAST